MSVLVLDASLFETAISANDLALLVKSESCGAIATFSGEVRDFDKGKKVLQLKYEIHPTTESTLYDITHEVASRYEFLRCAVRHRYGYVPIGESALAVAVATPHRADAFKACAELVDEIKSRVPIWKHQTFDDGTDEWVNSS